MSELCLLLRPTFCQPEVGEFRQPEEAPAGGCWKEQPSGRFGPFIIGRAYLLAARTCCGGAHANSPARARSNAARRPARPRASLRATPAPNCAPSARTTRETRAATLRTTSAATSGGPHDAASWRWARLFPPLLPLPRVGG